MEAVWKGGKGDWRREVGVWIMMLSLAAAKLTGRRQGCGWKVPSGLFGDSPRSLPNFLEQRNKKRRIERISKYAALQTTGLVIIKATNELAFHFTGFNYTTERIPKWQNKRAMAR